MWEVVGGAGKDGGAVVGGFRDVGGSFPASEGSQGWGELVILARAIHSGTGVRVPLMPVIQVSPAEGPNGIHGEASSGVGVGVPVVLVCGYWCGEPGKSGSGLAVWGFW